MHEGMLVCNKFGVYRGFIGTVISVTNLSVVIEFDSYHWTGISVYPVGQVEPLQDAYLYI